MTDCAGGWGGSNARALGAQPGLALVLVLSSIKLARGPWLTGWLPGWQAFFTGPSCQYPGSLALVVVLAFALAVAKQAPSLYLLHGPSWSPCLSPPASSFPGILRSKPSVCVSESV